MKTPTLAAILAITGSIAVAGQTIDLARYRMVDLSHGERVRTRSTGPRRTSKFTLTREASGPTPGGWFYAANSLARPSTAARTSTRPATSRRRAARRTRFRCAQLIAPAVVIDVRRRRRRNPDYRLTRGDVQAGRKLTGRSRAARPSLLRPAGARAGRTQGVSRRRHARRRVEALFPSYEEAAETLVQERRSARSASTRPRSTTAPRRTSSSTGSPQRQRSRPREPRASRGAARRGARDRAAHEDRRRVRRTAARHRAGAAVRKGEGRYSRRPSLDAIEVNRPDAALNPPRPAVWLRRPALQKTGARRAESRTIQRMAAAGHDQQHPGLDLESIPPGSLPHLRTSPTRSATACSFSKSRWNARRRAATGSSPSKSASGG